MHKLGIYQFSNADLTQATKHSLSMRPRNLPSCPRLDSEPVFCVHRNLLIQCLAIHTMRRVSLLAISLADPLEQKTRLEIGAKEKRVLTSKGMRGHLMFSRILPAETD